MVKIMNKPLGVITISYLKSCIIFFCYLTIELDLVLINLALVIARLFCVLAQWIKL
jgi:hypothetical protein